MANIVMLYIFIAYTVMAYVDMGYMRAEKGTVLLKNDGILPLTEAAKGLKIAFIGPQANYTQDMLSAPQYHGQNKLVDSNSPLMAAMRRGWSVTYAQGCNVCDARPRGYPNMACEIPKANASRANFSSALDAAKAAQVAVLFLGNDQSTEAENFDRSSLALPGAQQAECVFFISRSMLAANAEDPCRSEVT